MSDTHATNKQTKTNARSTNLIAEPPSDSSVRSGVVCTIASTPSDSAVNASSRVAVSTRHNGHEIFCSVAPPCDHDAPIAARNVATVVKGKRRRVEKLRALRSAATHEGVGANG